MYSRSQVVEQLLQVVSKLEYANTGDEVDIIGMGAEKLKSTCNWS